MFIREFGREFDNEWLLKLDASFSTDCVYHVVINELSVKLTKEKLDVLFHKSYSLSDIKDAVETADYSVIAEFDGTNAGIAIVKYETWNKRAILTGIFVTPEFKQKGIGRALVDAAIKYAKTIPARCLWLETQNVNYPAIQFYKKLGFEFCGFDQTLYDPAFVSADEIAFYFALSI